MYYNVKPSGLSELYYVTLHEIGHVLGIGILWSYETPNSENTPIISKKIGRNEACPCGSGKKYKNCHGNN